MYISNAYRSTKLSSVLLVFFFLTFFTLPVAAVDLPFDPNDFTFLVYDPGGNQSRITAAMEKILDRDLEENEIRSAELGKHVTPNDLETHDILIVGWNDGGYTSGLDDEILAAGITGRVILSGHDLDYHTVEGPTQEVKQAAETMLIQAIDWVLKGCGTGLITLGCTSAFPYLPEVWDVNAYASFGEDVTEFTAEGLASGVYDALEPNDMDNWGRSYHNIFTIQQYSFFVPFELGGDNGNDIITIASYKIKLPYFSIKKDANGVNCVSPLISEVEHEFMGEPYNWFYYNIDCNANGHADTNVFTIDYLPIEVDYNSSDPCGLYDPNSHTVTWDINDIPASYSNTFRIQVAVNYYAKPGHTITNICEMEGDRYYKYTTLETYVCCYGGNIIYVDADANGFDNGTSWPDAYKDLQDALHTARMCGREQIWVAEGTYRPTDINDTSARPISFELVDNVAIYGGFPPGGGVWTQRNPYVYETILSGDIGTSDYQYDNSYHVVKCVDVNDTVLDGFIITAGKANGSGDDGYGGGIYCKDSNNFALTDCNVSGNSASNGGALYNESCDSNITNGIFAGNTASESGGGIYNYESSPTIINCAFSGNSVTTLGDSYGGAI